MTVAQSESIKAILQGRGTLLDFDTVECGLRRGSIKPVDLYMLGAKEHLRITDDHIRAINILKLGIDRLTEMIHATTAKEDE